MNSWKVILATMVIFGAGVVTGGLLVRNTSAPPARMHRQTPGPSRQPQMISPGNARVDFLKRVQSELDLTEDQRTRVEEILKKSQERTRKLMEPVSPLLREEVQKTREEFKDVLTQEQRNRFERLWKQQQRPREKGSGDRPQRPPRGGADTNDFR